jgi:hypothetical protein
MWPFKKTELASAEEFPAVIDTLRDKLKNQGFANAGDRLHRLVHQGVWTTSNKFYAELGLALREIREQTSNLTPELSAEIRRLTKSINQICRWR